MPNAAGPSRRPLILATLLFCAFAVNVDVTLVNITLPTLVRELHATTRELQWIVDAYTLVFASLVLAAGSLSDRFGRRELLLAGIAVYGVGNLAAGFVNSPGALIALRAVMGLGAALMFPSTLSILTNVFTERKERAAAIGAWGAATGGAIALGPIVGGAALQAWSWHAAFLIKVPLAVLAFAAVALVVPTSRDPEARRVDLVGMALVGVAVGTAVYAIIQAPDAGWGSASTLALLAGAAVIFAAWLRWERHTPSPMFDLELLRDPRFTAASGSITIAFFALSGFIFMITQYFQFLQGYGPFEAGVRLLPVATSVGISSLIGTQLAVRYSTRAVISTGLLSLAIAFAWVSTGAADTSYLTIAGQMVFLGSGMGLTTAPATESLMGAASDSIAGVASAVNDTTRELGSTLGVAVIGSVFASLYRSSLDSTNLTAYPQQAVDATHDSVGAALVAVHRVAASGQASAAAHLRDTAFDAFISGLQAGCLVAAGVCFAGSIAVMVGLRGRRERATAQAPEAIGVES